MHAEFPELAPGKGLVAGCGGLGFRLLVLWAFVCLECRLEAADKPSSPTIEDLYFFALLDWP